MTPIVQSSAYLLSEYVNKIDLYGTPIKKVPVQYRSRETVSNLLGGILDLVRKGTPVADISLSGISHMLDIAVGTSYSFFTDKHSALRTLSLVLCKKLVEDLNNKTYEDKLDILISTIELNREIWRTYPCIAQEAVIGKLAMNFLVSPKVMELWISHALIFDEQKDNQEKFNLLHKLRLLIDGPMRH